MRTHCCLAPQLRLSTLKPLAINVSTQQFQRKNFVRDVTQLVTETGVDTSLIQIELTESVLLENDACALIKLDRLSDLGFKLAIDDFGTGYSSLSYISKP